MASQFDIAETAAAIYAESLWQLANEASQAEEIGEELRELNGLWRADPTFAAMMSSAAIDVAARRGMIRKAFGNNRVTRLVMNMLLVLNDKRRSMILPSVCEAYRRKLDNQLGREQVHVTSVAELSGEQREQIREQVKRLTGREADLVERLDPNMLGGITIQVSDQVFDMSLRRRLSDMQKGLLAGVERRLLEGVSRFVTQ